MKWLVHASLVIAALFLTSCSDAPRKEDAPKSAGEIMDKYVDTLTKAPGKAREAAGAEEERNKSMEKSLEELDK
jgi:hypothetical protein